MAMHVAVAGCMCMPLMSDCISRSETRQSVLLGEIDNMCVCNCLGIGFSTFIGCLHERLVSTFSCVQVLLAANFNFSDIFELIYRTLLNWNAFAIGMLS